MPNQRLEMDTSVGGGVRWASNECQINLGIGCLDSGFTVICNAKYLQNTFPGLDSMPGGVNVTNFKIFMPSKVSTGLCQALYILLSPRSSLENPEPRTRARGIQLLSQVLLQCHSLLLEKEGTGITSRSIFPDCWAKTSFLVYSSQLYREGRKKGGHKESVNH